MKRNYSLEVESSGDFFFSKGHWPITNFIHYLQGEYGYDVAPEKVYYSYWRVCWGSRDDPYLADYDGGEPPSVYMDSKPGRGAFPVTVCEHSDCKEIDREPIEW